MFHIPLTDRFYNVNLIESEETRGDLHTFELQSKTGMHGEITKSNLQPRHVGDLLNLDTSDPIARMLLDAVTQDIIDAYVKQRKDKKSQPLSFQLVRHGDDKPYGFLGKFAQYFESSTLFEPSIVSAKDVPDRGWLSQKLFDRERNNKKLAAAAAGTDQIPPFFPEENDPNLGL